MLLNLDYFKQKQQEKDSDSKLQEPHKIVIESVEQYIPDEINESMSSQQQKYQKPQASVVIPAIGGFLTDEAIDFKVNFQNIRRITIFSQFSFINDDVSNYNITNISRFLAWGILIYQTINNAIIPAWIMTVTFDKYLRIVWRFFLQTLFLIPLIMHEKRTSNQEIKAQYQLYHILQPKNLKKLYLASLIPSVSQSIFLFCFEYTYVATVFLLGQQTNFWLSILRSKHQNHSIERLGQIIWFFGLFIIIINLSQIEVLISSQTNQNFINIFLFLKSPYKRILIGTTLPLISSFLSAKFSYLNIQVREIFPMHLTNFFISLFNCVNILIAGFFIDGVQFDYDHFFGLFGLFYQSRIIMFIYICIIIIIGIYLCSILSSKLFDQFTLVLFNMMEPILTSILLRFTGVQYYPELLQYIGYIFLQCGQLIIILGQKLFQSQNSSKSLEQQK